MNKRPTIQTIAELAGVSRGTVDRVLNNRSYVRADVRARVLNAIQETGYLSPKEAHRQAAEAKLPLKPVRLGVLLPNWSGPFHEDVPRGIQAARSELEKRDVEVRVCTCEYRYSARDHRTAGRTGKLGRAGHRTVCIK